MVARHFVAFAVACCTGVTFPGAARAQVASDSTDPQHNFEVLWRTFDRDYALFGAKHVDWDVLYRVYRPLVSDTTTDEQLFAIMSDLLGHLNDNHVYLMAGDRVAASGIAGDMLRADTTIMQRFLSGEVDDFSLNLVKREYLHDRYEQRADEMILFGWLSDSVGYVHLRAFQNLEASAAAIDEVVAEFQGAAGIIIDVRASQGGDDRVGNAIANRFADRRRPYMTTRTRNGPSREDFGAPTSWFVEPGGPAQFTGPVILLQHRLSLSAAENFALAMRVLPHATVVGDISSGVFADTHVDRLPNGWLFRVSTGLFVDLNGFCWEGIGVPADIRQVNRRAEIEDGRDRALDLAVRLIRVGRPPPRERG